MFLLKLRLRKRNLRLLREFAAGSGVALEHAAREIFTEALQSIGKNKKAPGKQRRRHGPQPTRLQRDQVLGALIREHGLAKSDGEIGRLMEPPVGISTVRLLRLSLGIRRQRGWVRHSAIVKAIDREEFEHMVIHDGYTLAGYLRLKNLHCTRRRFEQVVDMIGLRHRPEDRAPEWILNRRARRVGRPELADREWLAKRLAGATSITGLCADLAMSERDLHFFVRGHQFTHPSQRKYGLVTVDLVCAGCGAPFKRFKRLVDKVLAKAGNKPVNFYCSTSCVGRTLLQRGRRGDR